MAKQANNDMPLNPQDEAEKEAWSTSAAAQAEQEALIAAQEDTETETEPATIFHRPYTGYAVWTNVIINDFKISVTKYEGQTPQQIYQATMDLLAALRLIYQDETVRTFGALRDGRDTPIWIGNKGPTAQQKQTQAEGKSSMPPKGTGQESGTIPKKSTSTPTSTPTNGANSDAEGGVKTQACYQIAVKHEDASDREGNPYRKRTFLLKFRFPNGNEADLPMQIACPANPKQKFGGNLLQEALEKAGYDVEQWAPATYYPLDVAVSWRDGKPMPNRTKPDGSPMHYRDYLSFVVSGTPYDQES